MTANFQDYFKTVQIFPDDCPFSGWFQNFPDFPRWLPIFWMILKGSRFFQMQIVTPNTANFVWQTNFCLGGRGYPKFAKKIAPKTGNFGPKTIYFSPFWSIFNITLYTNTVFSSVGWHLLTLRLGGGGSGGAGRQGHTLPILWQCHERQKRAF